jgi:hypothetical protein
MGSIKQKMNKIPDKNTYRLIKNRESIPAVRVHTANNTHTHTCRKLFTSNLPPNILLNSMLQ